MKRTRSTKSPLKSALIISALFHLTFIVIVLVAPSGWFIDPKPPIDFVWIELPKGVGEDITTLKETKQLPDSTIQDQKITPLKPLPKPKEKTMPEPKVAKKKTVKKKKVKKRSSMDRALAKIDKRLKNRDTAQVKTPGSGFEAGTSTKVVKDKGYQTALIKYRALVKSRIRRQFRPPEGVQGKVVITVFISKSGHVLSKRWARKASSDSLNQAAWRAVDRASPFPIPPDPLKWEAYTEGFTIDFK